MLSWRGFALAQLPLKRFYKYVLKRTIGGLLEHEIDLEQLDVQLYQGIVQLKALELNVEQLNMAIAGAGILFQFISGFIGTIKMDVPWRALLQDSCKVYVGGLRLVAGEGADARGDTSGGLASTGAAAAEPAASAMGQSRDEAAPRYSEEGVETLSRLVKHVLSRMEVCFEDTSFSVLAPRTQSALCVRATSLIIFSEYAADGVEARMARLGGIDVFLEPQALDDQVDGAQAEALTGEVLLASASCPEGTQEAGLLRMRRCSGEDSDSKSEVSAGGTQSAAGVHLDVQIVVHALRFAMAPDPWRLLVRCVTSLMEVLLRERDQEASDEAPCMSEMIHTSRAQRHPFMVQSLVESSLLGKPRDSGFWQELYNLYEADSMLEDAAEGGRDSADHEESALAEDLQLDEAPAASADRDSGPLLGFSVSVNVKRVSALLALGGSSGSTLRPSDVRLDPGPTTSVSGDQVQLFVEDLEFNFAKDAPCAPTLISQARHLSLYFHTHSPDGPSRPVQSGDIKQEADAVHSPTFCGPEEFLIHSQTEGDIERSMIASSMWCSAKSNALAESVRPPLPLIASRSPSASSCQSWSVGAQSEDSGLHSAACSVHSLDEVSAAIPEVAIPRSSRSSADRPPAAVSQEPLFRSVMEPSRIDDFCQATASSSTEDVQGFASAIVGAVGAAVPAEATIAAREASGVAREALEVLFFSRTTPLQELLLGCQAAEEVAPPSVETAGFERGWRQHAPGFQTKCVLHFVALPTREGPASDGRGDNKPWLAPSLPSPDHPLWDGLRIVGGGPCSLQSAAGREFRVSWVGSYAAAGAPSVEAELQPLVVTLCPASVRMMLEGLPSFAASSDCEELGQPVQAASGQLAEAGPAGSGPPHTSATFAFTGIAPSVRLEVSLDSVEGRQYCIVGHLICPRLSAQPQRTEESQQASGPSALCEEVLRAEVENMTVHVLQDSPSVIEPVVVRVFSLDHARTPVRQVATHRASLSMFRRSCNAEAFAQPCIDPESEAGSPVGASAPAAALADWTRISAPAAARQRSRSSELLQQMRQASQRLLRPGATAPTPAVGSSAKFDAGSGSDGHRGGTGACAAPAEVGVDAESAGAAAQLARGAHVELEVSVPGSVRLCCAAGHAGLLRNVAQEAARQFGGLSAGSTTGAAMPSVDQRQATSVEPPSLACTLRVGCVQVDLLDGACLDNRADPGVEEMEDACSDRLRFRVRPLYCRFVQTASTFSQFCAVGQDLSVEALRPPFEAQEELVRPWFSPSLHPARSSAAPQRDVSHSAGQRAAGRPAASGTSTRYPWEPREARCDPDLVLPCLHTLPGDGWREDHSLLVLLDQDTDSAGTMTKIDVKLSRLVFNISPRIWHTFAEWRTRLTPQSAAPAEQQHAASEAQVSTARLACRFSALDCLVDLPSEAYARQWNVAAPLDLTALPKAPASLCSLDGENWRAVLHMGCLQAANHCADNMSLAGLDVHAADFNVFVVDHPCRLSQLTLASLAPEPVALLKSLGFALVLNVSSAAAVWRSRGAGSFGGDMPPQHLDAEVGSISVSVCADTVRCLVSVGTDLMEALTAAAGEPQAQAFKCHDPTQPPGAGRPPSKRPMPPTSDDCEHEPEHIDMFAFESHTAPARERANTSPAAWSSEQRLAPQSAAEAFASVPEPGVDGAARKVWKKPRRYKIVSDKKVGILPQPDVREEASEHIKPGEVFDVSEERSLLLDGRTYLRLADGRGWVPQCSRKDPTKVIVEPAPAERRCKIISDKKVGILSMPDVREEASEHLKPGQTFEVIEERSSPEDGRTYWRLADGRGWVPQCSRKDPTKVIVAPVELAFPERPEVAQGSVAGAEGNADGEAALEGMLIHDYIRAQEQQQPPTLIRTISGSEQDRRSTETHISDPAQANSSPVALCLFNPEAYPESQLRDLCREDETARRELNQLYKEAGLDAAAPPCDSIPARQEEREVLHQDGSAAVWFVNPAEVTVVQDHFTDRMEPPEERCRASRRSLPAQLAISVCCEEVHLTLYGGEDFDEPVGAKPAPAVAALDTAGPGRASKRRHSSHLSLQLQHTRVELKEFCQSVLSEAALLRDRDPGGTPVRQFLVRAKEISLLDHVQSSVFSHVLSYFEDEASRPRPSHADMLYMRVDELAPPDGTVQAATAAAVGTAQAPEYRVDLRLLPLKLTVDQDVVQFLVDFLQLCTQPGYIEEPQEVPAESFAGDQAPTVDQGDQNSRRARAATLPAETSLGARSTEVSSASAAQQQAPFFQHVNIGALLLSVDYRAKRLDVDALRRGDLWELLNLLPILEGLQIAFRSVAVRNAPGLNQVIERIVSAWSADLNRTQILRCLTGVTPIRSFANIGAGFAEMVLEPLKLYRTGGDSKAVSRTMLRGLVSFMRHVTVESIDITERMFVGTQSALEYVTSCIKDGQGDASQSTGPQASAAGAAAGGLAHGVAPWPPPEDLQRSLSGDTWTPVERGAAHFLQPGGAAEGLEQACTNLTRGVKCAGQAVVLRPLKELQRGAPREQVLRSVVSGIPMCVLRPAIGATAAATSALQGVRNSVDPVHKREVARKFKGPE